MNFALVAVGNFDCDVTKQTSQSAIFTAITVGIIEPAHLSRVNPGFRLGPFEDCLALFYVH